MDVKVKTTISSQVYEKLWMYFLSLFFLIEQD